MKITVENKNKNKLNLKPGDVVTKAGDGGYWMIVYNVFTEEFTYVDLEDGVLYYESYNSIEELCDDNPEDSLVNAEVVVSDE